MAEGEIGSRVRPREKTRVFFALWPEDSIRKSLAATAARMNVLLRGRTTRETSLHLTLVFLGDVDAAEIPALLTPTELLARKFDLVLDRWGQWAHNGIGWVAPSETPGALAELVGELEIWLGKRGYVLEQRAYRPHVTLVRKSRSAALPDLPAAIVWPVREFVLLQSRQDFAGSQYEILGRWPLC